MRYVIHWTEDPRIKPMLAELAGEDSFETIHARFAAAARRWSDRNFERGGEPKWKPLSANTLIQRRSGSDLSKVLRDRGHLMASMQTDHSRDHAVLYSRDKRAMWHHEGTRPYVIRPKNAKFLAFRIAPGAGNTAPWARWDVVGYKEFTRTTKAGKRQTLRRKKWGYRGLKEGQKGNALFLQEVHHPGLPARPLLPTETQVWSEIDPVKIVSDYIDEVKSRG